MEQVLMSSEGMTQDACLWCWSCYSPGTSGEVIFPPR